MLGNQQSQSKRIDTPIDRYSQWHCIIAFSWLILLLLVAILNSLIWWQWLLMAVLASSVLFFWYLRKRVIVHITQPVSGGMTDASHLLPWFIYLAVNKNRANDSGNGEEEGGNNQQLQLWQGILTKSYVNRYLIIVYFNITEPYQRDLPVLIWRDQVDRDSWRRLQVLARMS